MQAFKACIFFTNIYPNGALLHGSIQVEKHISKFFLMGPALRMENGLHMQPSDSQRKQGVARSSRGGSPCLHKQSPWLSAEGWGYGLTARGVHPLVMMRIQGRSPWSKPSSRNTGRDPTAESLARIQSVQGWSMGFQRES